MHHLVGSCLRKLSAKRLRVSLLAADVQTDRFLGSWAIVYLKPYITRISLHHDAKWLGYGASQQSSDVTVGFGRQHSCCCGDYRGNPGVVNLAIARSFRQRNFTRSSRCCATALPVSTLRLVHRAVAFWLLATTVPVTTALLELRWRKMPVCLPRYTALFWIDKPLHSTEAMIPDKLQGERNPREGDGGRDNQFINSVRPLCSLDSVIRGVGSGAEETGDVSGGAE